MLRRLAVVKFIVAVIVVYDEAVFVAILVANFSSSISFLNLQYTIQETFVQSVHSRIFHETLLFFT
jgi:hypothetical protein